MGKLVSLCTHLLNIGYFDNNIIKELSTSLAGPFSGNGHSKIYNDGKVYDLGIKFVLDTDDIVIPFDGESNLLEEITKSELPISNQIYIKEYNLVKLVIFVFALRKANNLISPINYHCCFNFTVVTTVLQII